MTKSTLTSSLDTISHAAPVAGANPLVQDYNNAPVVPATTMARGLNGLLLIVMGVLAITCAALSIIGLFMLFPNGFREEIFSELQAKGIETNTGIVAITCFAFVVLSAAYMTVILILRKIVNTLMQGDPFVPENISRLRIMWIILAVSEVFRMVIHLIGVGADEGESMINIRLGTWFMVFVIAALSEVFRHGAELRRDQELTV